jgi:hypothetical protein
MHDYGRYCSLSWSLCMIMAVIALVNNVLSLCMRDKLNTTYYVFLYARNKQLTFIALLLMIFCLCYFSCYNMVAKFYCQDYIFYAHV